MTILSSNPCKVESVGTTCRNGIARMTTSAPSTASWLVTPHREHSCPRFFRVSRVIVQLASALSCSREPTTRSKTVERRMAIPSPISPVPPTMPIFTYPTSGRSRFSSVAASVTPCMVWTTFPSFSIMRVGTTWIPYFCARSICSSTSIFLISTVSPSFFASSSIIGVCIRQGPHHVAKKSYRTGFDISSYPVVLSVKKKDKSMVLLFGEDLHDDLAVSRPGHHDTHDDTHHGDDGKSLER